MTIPVLVTLGFLPVYLWLRAPYCRLPLHCDTGFYVSNHTISTRRLRFSKGWNAKFAGCSKAVPELFYSLVYLLAEASAGMPHGAHRYKTVSRLSASLFNYVTAVVVGALAWQLGGSPTYYCAGLVVYCLISSEPQYGVYYECGEWFGLLGNVVSMLLLSVGMAGGGVVWIGAAAFVWMADAFFVKLSSGVGFVVLFGGIIVAQPGAWMAVAIGFTAGAVLFHIWILANGRNPWSLLRPLARHETAYGQRAQWRIVSNRLAEKGVCLWRTVRAQPIFPTMAAAACVVAPPPPIVWCYAAAVLLAYFVQAADCWYYQIPLLPVLALLATGMVATGSDGLLVLACGGALWLAYNGTRGRQSDSRQMARWAWAGHRPESEMSRGFELERAAEVLRPMVRGRSLLVYGPLNQAYVLLSASYDTAIITPESYLDEMAPGWQRELNAQLLQTPPQFVLDTGRCFDAAALRGNMGLDYRLQHVVADTRFFELVGMNAPAADALDIRSYRPQSEHALANEYLLAGDALTRDGAARGAGDTPAGMADVAAVSLGRLLDALADAGYSRLGVYGAGRYTARHLDVYRRSRAPVVVVLDDRPGDDATCRFDWPVRRLETTGAYDVDAIVLSTDRFAGVMRARVRAALGRAFPVFAAGDRPPHPTIMHPTGPRPSVATV